MHSEIKTPDLIWHDHSDRRSLPANARWTLEASANIVSRSPTVWLAPPGAFAGGNFAYYNTPLRSALRWPACGDKRRSFAFPIAGSEVTLDLIFDASVKRTPIPSI